MNNYSYNKNNYYRNGGYQQRSGYAQAPQQRPQFKKSGFEYKMTEEGPICWGWRKTKMGIQKVYATPYKGSKYTKSKNGIEWINLFVRLTNRDSGQIVKTSGLFSMVSHKLVITDLGLVGTTNGGGQTRSGKFSKGFFGKLR